MAKDYVYSLLHPKHTRGSSSPRAYAWKVVIVLSLIGLILLFWPNSSSYEQSKSFKVSMARADFEKVRKKNPTYQDLRKFSKNAVVQNWISLGCVDKNTTMDDIYHPDLHVEKMSRDCHFANAFFGPVNFEWATHDNDIVRVAKVLHDLYFRFGIINSKRAGSLLGAYRSEGHLRGDSFTGDHFLFLPNFTTVSFDCMGKALLMTAWEHGCEIPIPQKKWFDGFDGGNIKCGHYESHSTAFEANYLFLNKMKNEALSKYGVYLHDAMRALCFTQFNGIKSMVFDTPHIQSILRATYGNDFLIPQPGKRNGFNLIEQIKFLIFAKDYFSGIENFMDPNIIGNGENIYTARQAASDNVKRN